MQYIYQFAPMPGVASGPGVVERSGKFTAAFGRKALLITGASSLERSGSLARILKALEEAGLTVHHCRIDGEPSPAMIDAAVNDSRDKAPAVVLAVGGGSVLDAGKAVAAMLKETGSVLDFLEGVGAKTPSGQSLPVIAVPTTSGTGSEATKNAVISEVGRHGFKKSLRHDNYIPKLAILDPILCLSTPPSVTAACGMDALTQLIESYVSTRASVLTDALALDGLRHLIPALPEACDKGGADIDCRASVAYGAFLSGVTLANAGLGVVHGVAGPMGGIVDIPHGVACANLLPFAVKATVENLTASDTAESKRSIEKFARIAELFGASHNNAVDRCRHLTDSLYRWLEDLSIARLGRFGLTDDDVESIVESASNKCNPLPLTAEQMARMIRDRC
ncbi:alcohol dehydrogenase [Desulfosarcina widdelii]|uniref:Alcohol dehydrogenase n=1 Tax=Desulfosarcina widdelii TaxID=947919 RepID=A0A5K7ZFU0_9BACT|nr:iron-containing alcohol dehydrogenase [Desulfosarcina widdelii]BBO78661.1 alcohol dehydrogenase [Desulfosarcina widdelii]